MPSMCMHTLSCRAHGRGNAISMWASTDCIATRAPGMHLAPTTTGAQVRVERTPYQYACIEEDRDIAYRCTVGNLQWLIGLRPDIQYAAKDAARGPSDVRSASCAQAKHLRKYFNGASTHRHAFNQLMVPGQRPSEIGVSRVPVVQGDHALGAQRVGVVGNLVRYAFRAQGSVAMLRRGVRVCALVISCMRPMLEEAHV